MIAQLIHRIKVRQAELQVALAIGSVTTWESYQRIVGEHRGLQSTLEMIEQMLEEDKNGD